MRRKTSNQSSTEDMDDNIGEDLGRRSTKEMTGDEDKDHSADLTAGRLQQAQLT